MKDFNSTEAANTHTAPHTHPALLHFPLLLLPQPIGAPLKVEAFKNHFKRKFKWSPALSLIKWHSANQLSARLCSVVTNWSRQIVQNSGKRQIVASLRSNGNGS